MNQRVGIRLLGRVADLRRPLRGLLAVVVAAGAALTCENPTTPARRIVSLAVQPVLKIALGSFGGLSVDQARLIVVAPPADTVATQTFGFSADSAQIAAKVSVTMPASGAASFAVTVQLLGSGTLLFLGTDTVVVPGGLTTAEPSTVVLHYVGPGANVAAIQIAPRDTSIAPDGSLQYRLTATDSSAQAVTQFYASWTTSAASNTVNANGLFHAGKTNGTAWVYAHTPTGIWDSTRVTVAPPQSGVPANLVKVAGDGQSAAAGTAVAVAPAVKVTDGLGAAVSGVAVTFAVASGGGSVTGAATTTNASGVATVGSWTLGAVAGANTLTASVATLPAVTFTATGTGAAGPAIQLSVPGNLIPVGGKGLLLVKLTQPAPSGGLTVTVTSDSTKYVTVAAATVAFASGDTLKADTLNGVAIGASILHATASGYTAGITAAVVTPNLILLQPSVTVAAGQSATLGITISPAAPTGGLAMTLASTDTTTLTVTTPTVNITAGSTTGSATIKGIKAGLVAVTATATGYAPGATAVTVTGAGTAAFLTLVSGGNQGGSPDVQLPQPIVVRVSDSTGAGVPGVAVTFAVTAGGGSVGTPNATTDANGLASTTWKLGGSLNAQTMTATASGLIGSPLTVTANGAAVASTTVTPKRDTLTAIGSTFGLTAQAKDVGGANVSGSFTWTSRKPSAVTVNVVGVVRAVTNNDSSWVVATEAGGTSDSALIVVQQKIASVLVTPAVRNIYLTRNYQFTAKAVDGLGTQVPGAQTFTWSTTAPAVATVDTTGYVVGVGLGTAQIRATTGTITGVANVSVITPITRIAVVVDTTGAAKTDTFSMPSLGLKRRYRAIAHDTLDAVMSGLTFSWASSNGSVAIMNSTTGDTASAISAANGVTRINVTAQGFTSNPGALLTVAQVLATIQLTGPGGTSSASVGVGGKVSLTARGLDANSRYIPGGSFKYASQFPSLATVDSASGQVTGVATGTDTITASSGAITSNHLQVTVGGAVSPIISFGRDTVSVGRGSTASIPILLTTPAASPLIVKLTVADTFAYWSTPTVTIPSGQTSINATLNGRNAGTTTVTASDSSGLGYASGSAVAKVTANMRLTYGSYGINTTDIVTTQVLLSDPSPAGGTYVTFGYSTPGIAKVSPDPAFIPAGQLAADIQVLAVGAGTTNITPSALGVNGTASSFTAYAPVLTPYPTTMLIGQGQYNPNAYVQIPTYTNVPVPVTITTSDSTTIAVTPLVTIPSNAYYAYFTATANLIGTATLTLSSPGWTASSPVTVRSTTPHVGACCGGTYNTTSPQTSVTVYSEDSVKTSHYRVNSLLVHVASRDSTVMKVLDTLVTIQPASYYATARIIPGGAAGTTWVVVTASGHTPDSVQYTVVGPKLQFSWTHNYLGTGQYDPNVYISTPNNVTAPLAVSFANSNPAVATLPAADTVPTSSYYSYFNVVAQAVGTDTFIASASGYQPDTALYTVTSPRLTGCCSTTFNNFGSGSSVTVYTADSVGTTHYRLSPLSVAVVSTDTTVLKVDSSVVTVDSGTYYNSRAHVTPVGVGTAKIIFSAAGHVPDTLAYTVQTPKLSLSFTTSTLGLRQHYSPNGNGFYVATPDYRTSPLAVTITQLHANVDSLSTTTVTVPTSTYYAYLDTYGLTTGKDTIIVSAPGYAPDTAFLTVTTPQFYACCMPSTATTTNPPIGITVYTADSVNTSHYASDTVVVAAVSSDSNVIRPAQPYFRILKNTYYTSTSVNVVGPGSATITYSDSAGTGYVSATTGSVTVTGPAFGISNATPVLGLRQSGGQYSADVYTQYAVAESLVVRLSSSDPRVVTVPDSVIIPTGSYYAYFPITSQDTVGTIQITASATGYTNATSNVQVTLPKFVVYATSSLYTTSQPSSISVYAADANGNWHYNTEAVTATLTSSAPSVASLDSATVTIPIGGGYVTTPKWSPGVVGTSQLSATDARSAFYKYNAGTANVQVVEPTLGFGGYPGALGIGQYQDYVSIQTPDYAKAAIPVTFSHASARTGTSTNLTNTPITGVTIDSGGYYKYFRLSGLLRGTDSLIASATSPAHNPDTLYTVVDSGRVDPLSGWPSPTIKAGDSVLVTLYARDPNTNVRYVVTATQFNFTSVSNIEFHQSGAVVTSVTIPADAQYVQFYLVGKTAGTGSATITNANYKTYTNTVTVQ